MNVREKEIISGLVSRLMINQQVLGYSTESARLISLGLSVLERNDQKEADETISINSNLILYKCRVKVTRRNFMAKIFSLSRSKRDLTEPYVRSLNCSHDLISPNHLIVEIEAYSHLDEQEILEIINSENKLPINRVYSMVYYSREFL